MKWSWSSIDDGRMERSQEVKVESIDTASETAVFIGSKNARHIASLASCSCTDFARTHNPCKHMIRLACELNKLDYLCDYHVSVDDDDNDLPKQEKRPGKKPNAFLSLSDYVVIDLETTDRYINTAGILDFGAVRVINNRVIDTFSMLANPGIPNHAEDRNHITADMIASAVPVIDALRLFLDFIGDSPVVGHNINSFDSNLIYDQSVLCFNRPFINDIVDTQTLFQKSHKGLPYGLLDACEHYGIVNEQAHRALSDALATQLLYERIKHYIYAGEPRPASFALGGYSDSIIYDNILRITADTAQNIILRTNKTGSSIFMFGSLAFSIKMNSRSQYIETSATAAEEYIGQIPGATAAKSGFRFPIACDKETASAYEEMISAVYEQLKSSAVGERFGCCNDFIRCSDARECLHKDNPEYNGCYYRRNLEIGRIFYGKNRNIDSFKSSSPAVDHLTAAFRFLIDNKIPYVDKTSIGGALWVLIEDESSPVIADLIAVSDLKFVYTANGSSTSHKKPAWYYKPSQKKA